MTRHLEKRKVFNDKSDSASFCVGCFAGSEEMGLPTALTKALQSQMAETSLSL